MYSFTQQVFIEYLLWGKQDTDKPLTSWNSVQQDRRNQVHGQKTIPSVERIIKKKEAGTETDSKWRREGYGGGGSLSGTTHKLRPEGINWSLLLYRNTSWWSFQENYSNVTPKNIPQSLSKFSSPSLCHLSALMQGSLANIFLVTALLRYNSHAIKFTILKYTIQHFPIYSQCCTTITTSNFRTFSSSPPKRNLVSISSYSPNLKPPSPWQLLVTFHLYGFASFGHFIWMESYSKWPLVSGFFHLA